MLKAKGSSKKKAGGGGAGGLGESRGGQRMIVVEIHEDA